MQMALYGAIRQIQHARDFLNASVLQIEQRDHVSWQFGKSFQTALHFNLVQYISAVILRDGKRFRDRIQGKCFPAGLRPKRRQARVPGDRVKPGGRGSPAVVRRQDLPQFQKYILRDLFGSALVFQEHHSHSENLLLVEVQNTFKRFSVPILLQQQLNVFIHSRLGTPGVKRRLHGEKICGIRFRATGGGASEYKPVKGRIKKWKLRL